MEKLLNQPYSLLAIFLLLVAAIGLMIGFTAFVVIPLITTKKHKSASKRYSARPYNPFDIRVNSVLPVVVQEHVMKKYKPDVRKFNVEKVAIKPACFMEKENNSSCIGMHYWDYPLGVIGDDSVHLEEMCKSCIYYKGADKNA